MVGLTFPRLPEMDFTMSSTPLVSIIVLNWNGKKCIRPCLESLFAQTYPRYEVIVVDNASTDDSVTIVRQEFPKARLIVNERNLGFAAGNNVGIKAAKGDLIAMFNNDAIADKNWLSEMVKALTSSPRIGVAGSLIFYHGTERVWSAGSRLDAFTGLIWGVPLDGRRENVSAVVADVDFVANCASLTKRAAFEKIGLLDEDYFFLNEDLDWCLAARRAGYTCVTVPSAIVYHMVGLVSGDIPLLRTYQHFRSVFHFYIKHLPVHLILSTLGFQLVVTTFVGWVTLKQSPKYSFAKIRAFWWGLRHLRHILRERGQLRSLGKTTYPVRLGEVWSVTRKWGREGTV